MFAFIICVTLSLCALPVAAEETASVKEGAIAGIRNFEDGDFFISEEVAGYIAELFIADMVETGLTVWDEDTAVVATVPMYDETGENVTAYSVEATEGYVVVSAYLDMPDIIFEWSDETAPLYSKFEAAPSRLQSEKSDAKIVYVGTLGYFYDNGGENLLDVEGTKVQRDYVENSLEELRSIDNVVQEVRESVVVEKMKSTMDSTKVGAKSSVITIKDPFAFAKEVYGQDGTWTCNDYKNFWESYAESSYPLIQDHLSAEYGKACVPIAITNILKLIGEKYGNNRLISPDPKAAALYGMDHLDIFNQIEGMKWGFIRYYYPGEGTIRDVIREYTEKAITKYQVSATVSGEKALSVTNIVSTFQLPAALMLIDLEKGKGKDEKGDPVDIPGIPYGEQHAVVGYAYTRLANSKTNIQRMFVKIADGFEEGSRYIGTNFVTRDKTCYYQITYGKG